MLPRIIASCLPICIPKATDVSRSSQEEGPIRSSSTRQSVNREVGARLRIFERALTTSNDPLLTRQALEHRLQILFKAPDEARSVYSARRGNDQPLQKGLRRARTQAMQELSKELKNGNDKAAELLSQFVRKHLRPEKDAIVWATKQTRALTGEDGARLKVGQALMNVAPAFLKEKNKAVRAATLAFLQGEMKHAEKVLSGSAMSESSKKEFMSHYDLMRQHLPERLSASVPLLGYWADPNSSIPPARPFKAHFDGSDMPWVMPGPDEKWTPLHCAAADGDIEGVEKLIKDKSRLSSDKFGNTPVHIAAQCRHPRIVKELLESPGYAGDTPNLFNWTALTMVAKKRQGETEGESDARLQIARQLAEGRFIPSQPTNEGWTALYLAAGSGDERMVEFLLNLKEKRDPATRLIDPDATDKHGYTALHVAAEQGHTGVVKLLIGAADLNLTTSEKSTALGLAACAGHEDVVESLLESGAQVDTADTRRFTPLCLAAAQGHSGVVRMLLEKGADPNAVTEDGWSSLSMAVAYDDRETIAALLDDERTQPSLKTAGAPSTLALAQQRKNVEFIGQLVERNKRLSNEPATGTFLSECLEEVDRRVTRDGIVPDAEVAQHAVALPEAPPDSQEQFSLTAPPRVTNLSKRGEPGMTLTLLLPKVPFASYGRDGAGMFRRWKKFLDSLEPVPSETPELAPASVANGGRGAVAAEDLTEEEILLALLEDRPAVPGWAVDVRKCTIENSAGGNCLFYALLKKDRENLPADEVLKLRDAIADVRAAMPDTSESANAMNASMALIQWGLSDSERDRIMKGRHKLTNVQYSLVQRLPGLYCDIDEVFQWCSAKKPIHQDGPRSVLLVDLQSGDVRGFGRVKPDSRLDANGEPERIATELLQCPTLKELCKEAEQFDRVIAKDGAHFEAVDMEKLGRLDRNES